ncbi:Acetyl-coenzyme A carboxylase carboxyl transferase subunit alpha [Dissostichus eleginoides]|uniref:Acetyl-coenzyme A carboxylase carboxyl transferase subunit alpha n=1 Tax=Dissostichus eleginoides TaxID=100907 RepID=A0AAD9CKZ4_DISEL|nr:Acetyl-coenzyme A carboxylase carboxyl transferase subunit alpha [Dissostichus eleginoides]
MIVQDDLFEAKLNFFLMVAREVTPFLKLYETDKPMLPFMSEDLSNILRSLMEKFIKPSVMKNATTTVKLLQVDLTDPVNHMDVTKLRVGFVTERGLEEHMKKNSGSTQISPCKKLVCSGSKGKVLKIKEVSTRKCTTVLCCLLVETGRIEEKCCDEIIREFGHFYDHSLMSASDSFRDFNPQSGRLDEFYQEHLSNKAECRHLWEVVKFVLVLSHGQASVERGFSINKEVMVENLKEHSLIAQRVINDHVHSVGGLLNIAYTKELLLSAASARQKYHIYLDDQRRLKQDEKKTQKRKGMMEEITQMKAKKKRMEEDIRVLMKSADNNAEKAESQGQLSFISKSNGLRRAAKEKERHLETLERQLTDKLKELRDTP